MEKLPSSIRGKLLEFSPVFTAPSYYSTEPDMEVEPIVQLLARRWTCEVMHRDTKQHLGIEEPKNGWNKTEANQNQEQRDRSDPVSRKDKQEEDEAVKRTVPTGLVVYAIVVIWYLQNGSAQETVKRVKNGAPYWTQKEKPSFADMLVEMRKEIWTCPFSWTRGMTRVWGKLCGQ